eukprot:c42204_g1_i1 orf=398-592(+)
MSLEPFCMLTQQKYLEGKIYLSLNYFSFNNMETPCTKCFSKFFSVYGQHHSIQALVLKSCPVAK